MSDIASRYRETSIDAATKAKLVQMLLGRAMQHARSGGAAAAEGRIEARFNENQRLSEIISVLRGHLDIDRGGGIARQLDAIYGHLQVVIMQIDVRADVTLYDHVLAILGDLERAWSEIAQVPAPLAAPTSQVAGTPGSTRGTAAKGAIREGFTLRA
ncbi:flagellar export chaperone FliS [Hyphomonas sp.]|jgi:flagellar protein FliS|uniref:flagellar export chaperone FliS n=1 Tax=Hyphomonas sp. TaxID=87 RepID=UPI0037BE8647